MPSQQARSAQSNSAADPLPTARKRPRFPLPAGSAKMHQGIDFTSVLDSRRAFLDAETIFFRVGSGAPTGPGTT
jgi:hypothetical protein